MWNLPGKIFPSRNERLLRSYRRAVRKINSLEESCRGLSNGGLRAKKDEFKQRLSDGAALTEILPEAFAVVREASQRTLGLRHFDMQLIGGMVLHEGRIAEMRTGEGKTLVATLPAYLNALTGGAVHIITVNDYLARRDAEWMGAVYDFLGLSTDAVIAGQSNEERRGAYRADITYGTNNEFGFDYLRDNMVFAAGQRVQRGRHFAVVDEVDSILIDEARTPLIISGPSEESADIYPKIDKLVRPLRPEAEDDDGGDYKVDEKARQITLSEAGHQRIEDLLTQAGMLDAGASLYDLQNINLFHHVNAALRARVLFNRNVDYLVRNGQVLIVDEFTGRVMEGRRWSDGLHQAIEAKEGVHIERENQTLASITFQNYFRLYDNLSGMTGTADTEAYEFQDIYGLEVVVIPTHQTMVRDDQADSVYITRDEKFDAIVTDIRDCVEGKQPVLVGTASIEVSEYLSGELKKASVAHQVLNAKHHEAESHIIAQAGCPGAVTIATNMAGRGTDIVLGGSLDAELAEARENGVDEVREKTIRSDWEQHHREVIVAGGLHIIGTERHESRRVDNQLRGRSGRQGDPGSSRFYLSLEDNLVRIFASDKVKSIIGKLGLEKGEAIEHPWVNRAIENAQSKVEAHNFDIRKNLLEYDDVANEQRKVIYQQRDELMETKEGDDDDVGMMLPEVLDAVVDQHMPADVLAEQWDAEGLEKTLAQKFSLACPVRQWLADDLDLAPEGVAGRIRTQAQAAYREKEERIGAGELHVIENILMLRILDHHWKEHLAQMDYLRQGIGLRSFAQKNPKQEYKREAFQMFERMLDSIRDDFIARLMMLQPEMLAAEQPAAERPPGPDDSRLDFRYRPAQDALHPGESAAEPAPGPGPRGAPVPGMLPAMRRRAPPPKPQTVRRQAPKIGRNQPCFCGSGKKYKHCHGRAG